MGMSVSIQVSIVNFGMRTRSHCDFIGIITTCKQSCGKAMFLQVSAILFTGGVPDPRGSGPMGVPGSRGSGPMGVPGPGGLVRGGA